MGFWGRKEENQNVGKHREKEGLQQQAGAGHWVRGTLRDAGQEFKTQSVEQRPRSTVGQCVQASLISHGSRCHQRTS